MNTHVIEPEFGDNALSESAVPTQAVGELASPTAPPGAAAPPEPKVKISQAMLKRLVRFNKENREIQPLIRQMKAAAAAGYEVEQGSCTLTLRPCKIRRKVPKQIIDALALTEDEVAQLETTLGTIEGVSALVKEFGEFYPFEA